MSNDTICVHTRIEAESLTLINAFMKCNFTNKTDNEKQYIIIPNMFEFTLVKY